MKQCAQCGAGFSDDARFCSVCGQSLPTPSEQPPARRKKPGAALIVAGVALIAVFCGLFVFSALTLMAQRADESKPALASLDDGDDEETAEAPLPSAAVSATAAPLTPPPTPTPTPYAVSSPELTDLSQMKIPGQGLLVYNGHTYQFVDQGVGWEESKLICEKLGGYLATIDSQEEMAFIQCNLPKSRMNLYWIGLNSLESPGSWKWLTPSQSLFANWAKNGDNPAAPYTLMFAAKPDITTKNGTWISSANTVGSGSFFDTDRVGFLCEWSASPSAPGAIVGNDPNNLPPGDGVTDLDRDGSISQYEQLLPYFDSDGYIFYDSSRRYLSRSELDALISPDSENYDVESMLFLLGFARNEIYARNGGAFESERYRTHYPRYDWYRLTPRTEVSFDMMNEYEQANILLIKQAERDYKALRGE